MACQHLDDFMWTEFCDWYIELSKPVLYGSDEQARVGNLAVLCYVLDKILKLLHPFVPFLTEKIYQSLPTHGKSIMVESFPTVQPQFNFDDDFKLMEEVKALISKLRNVRAEYGVIPSKRIKLHVIDKTGRLNDVAIYVEKLVGCERIMFETSSIGGKVVKAVTPIAEVEIPLGDLVDKDKELERLSKELKNCQGEIARANGKLSNQGFVAKAPAQLIEAEKQKLSKFVELEKQLKARIAELDD